MSKETNPFLFTLNKAIKEAKQQRVDTLLDTLVSKYPGISDKKDRIYIHKTDISLDSLLAGELPAQLCDKCVSGYLCVFKLKHKKGVWFLSAYGNCAKKVSVVIQLTNDVVATAWSETQTERDSLWKLVTV